VVLVKGLFNEQLLAVGAYVGSPMRIYDFPERAELGTNITVVSAIPHAVDPLF
jgi:hypothetical protein